MKAWEVVPEVIVRTTGFPLTLLEPLCDGALAAAAGLDLQARDRLDGLRAAGPRLARPTRRAVSRVRNGRHLDVDEVGDAAWCQRWNDAVDAADAASQALDRAVAEHAQRVAGAFEELRGDPRLRAAVASTAPGMLRDLDRDRLPSRSSRQLAGIVQRLCAKNETTAFFGPINYGRLDPSGADELSLRWSGPEALPARRVFAAHWLVESLVDAVAHDDAITPWLAPAALPLTAGLAARLPEELQELRKRADGQETLRRIAESSSDPARVLHAARAAFRARILDHQVRPPDGTADALADLAARVACIPTAAATQWSRRLTALLRLAQEYGGEARHRTSTSERFLTQVQELVPPRLRRRPERGFYSDRLPLREETAGDLDLRIGGVHAQRLLDDLEPLLDALAGHAVRTRAAARRRLAAALGEGTHEFLDVVSEAGGLEVAGDGLLGAALDRARAASPQARSVDVAAALRALPDEPSEGAACSLDLLLGARDVAAWMDGEVEVVVGDIHDTALLTAWGLQFHPRPGVAAAATAAALRTAAGNVPVLRVVSRRRSGLPAPEPAGRVFELGGRSAQPRPWKAEAADLVVRVEGDRARLVDRALGAEVALHNGELEGLVQQVFGLPRLRALPLSAGRRAPRLRCGRAVVQRAHGRLDADEVRALRAARSHRELVTWAGRVWPELRLPAMAVAAVRGERKPVVVHAGSPLLLANLRRLVDADREVVLTEFSPAPEVCWLQDGPRRHTSELRAVLVRAGRP